MLKCKLLKRILPMLLSAAMVVQSLPATALAAENESAEAQIQENAENAETAENPAKAENTAAAESAETDNNAQEAEQTGKAYDVQETASSAAPAQSDASGETDKTQIAMLAESEPAESTLTESTPKENTPVKSALVEEEIITINYDDYSGQPVDVKKDAPVWLKFTAPDAGEYIFVTSNWYISKNGDGDYNQGGQIDMYKGIEEDAQKIPDKYSTTLYYRNTYNMQKDETVYLKASVSTEGLNILEMQEMDTVSAYLYVRKAPAFTDTISDSEIVQLDDSAKIKFSYTAENSVQPGFALLHTDNPDFDFDAVNNTVHGMNQYTEFDCTVDDKFDTIDNIGVEGKDYETSGNTVTYFPTTGTLDAGKTYYYRIFARLPLAVPDGYNDNTRYYYVSCSETKQFTFTPAAPVDTSKIQVAMTAEAGYANISMAASITNPDNAQIVRKGFHITGETTREAEAWWKTEANGETESKTEFEGLSYFAKLGETVTITPYVTVKTLENGVSTDKEITGEAKTLTAKDKAELGSNLFTAQANTRSVQLLYSFDVKNRADKYFSVGYILQKADGTVIIDDGQEEIYSEASTMFNGSLRLYRLESGKLEPQTAYSITINLKASRNTESEPVVYTQTLDFTTAEEKTYTETDIPDAALRYYIARKIIGEDKSLTSSNLERITELNANNITDGMIIKNLTGIACLKNLKNLSLEYHDVEDISPITGLKALERANFRCNRVKTIPDLKGMASLKNIYLNNNEIPAAEFDLSKLPQTMQSDKETQDRWSDDKRNQRKEETLNTANTYYITGDGTALIYVEIDGVRGSGNVRTWDVTAAVDGKSYTLKKVSTYDYLLASNELAAGSHKIKVTAQENFGGLKLETAEKDIELKKLEPGFEYQKYIDKSAEWIGYSVYVPELGITPVEVYLVDPANKDRVVAAADKDSSGPNKAELSVDRLLPDDGTFVHGWQGLDEYKCTSVSGDLYYKYNLDSGSYDLIVKAKAKDNNVKEYRFKAYAAADYKKGLVTWVNYSDEYDNSRNYFYMQVDGEGLEYDKLRPQIKLEDGTVVAKYVSRIDNVYILEKLDGFPKEEYLPYDLMPADGYEISYNRGVNDRIYTAPGNKPVYVSYNAKLKEYVMYTSANIPANTQIELSMATGYPYWNDVEGKWNLYSGVIRATAKAAVGGAATKIEFLDGNGKPVYMLQYAYEWYYAASWKLPDSDVTSHASGIIRHTESGFCEPEASLSISYAGDWRFENAKEIPFKFYVYNYKDIISAGEKLTVSINNSDGTFKEVQPVEAVLSVDKEQEGRLAASGKLVLDAGYPAGEYIITASHKEVNGIGWVSVLGGEAFYQTYQSSNTGFYKTNQVCAVVRITTPSLKLDTNKFKFTFYDYEKNVIAAKKLGEFAYPESGTYYYYFSGVAEKYRSAYVKVEYDGKLGASLYDTKKTYYEANGDSKEYGELSYYMPYVNVEYINKIGFCYAFSHIDDYYVDILDDNNGTLITSINVKSKGRYYFTKADLDAVIKNDSKLEKLYTLVVRKGNITYLTYNGCNIGYKEAGSQEPIKPVEPVKPTDMSLNKTKMTINKGASDILMASLMPAGAQGTVTFTSSDTSKVKVEAVNGCTATLTAVDIGEAVITAAIDAGGTKVEKTCTVTVKGTYTETDKQAEIGKVGTLVSVINGNEAVTLKAVALPGGWAWENPDLRLAASDAKPVMSFPAVYTKAGYEPMKAELPVAVIQVLKVDIKGSSSITQKAAEPELYAADITAKGYKNILSSAVYAWSAKGAEKNVTLTPVGTDPVDPAKINAAAKDGATDKTEVLVLKVTIGGKEFTAEKTIDIRPEHIENIVITPTVTDNKAKIKNGRLYVSKKAEEGSVKIALSVTASKGGAAVGAMTDNKPNFAWSSSDENTAAVNMLENGNAELTVNGKGSVVVTAAANDEIKEQGELIVYVEESFEPVLETAKLSLNAHSESGAVIPLYANGANPVKTLTVDNANFEIKEPNGGYILLVKNEKRESVGKSETVKLTAGLEDGSSKTYELTVTVDTRLPKVAFKAVDRANTFYKNAPVVYTVSAAEKIEAVTANAGSGYNVAAFEPETGRLTLTYNNNDVKKADLTVKLEGYRTFTQSFNVSVQNKKPSYTADEMYLAKGAASGTTRVMSSKTQRASLDGVSVKSLTDGVTASIQQDGLLKLDFTKEVNKYDVELTSAAWNSSIVLKNCKVSWGKAADQLLISQNKIVLNNAHPYNVEIDAYVKNSTDKLTGISILPGKRNPSADILAFDPASQKLSVICPETAGKYTYTLTGFIGETKLKRTASLTVAVEDGEKQTNKAPKITLSGRGSINLIDREGTSIVYTPRLANISGAPKSVVLKGEAAGLFTAAVKDGKIELKAVQGVEMQTKSAYVLDFAVTLDNGALVTAAGIKVKPVNKPPRVKADAARATIFKVSDTKVSWNVAAGACAIEELELVPGPSKRDTYTEKFTITNTGAKAELVLTDKTLKPGRYNLTYRVKLADEAADAKAVLLRMTVTVK